MQPSTASAPSPALRSFAGVLAEAAMPELKFPPARDFDGLEPDVATLSYEHALNRHTRHRSEHVSQIPQLVANGAAKNSPAAVPSSVANASQFGACRKSASITLRLTAPESEKVRLRAAEAGLNVSEYVRSCVFEVETLRTQVKETLSALRRAESMQPTTQPAPHASWWARIAVFFSRRPQTA